MIAELKAAAAEAAAEVALEAKAEANAMEPKFMKAQVGPEIVRLETRAGGTEAEAAEGDHRGSHPVEDLKVPLGTAAGEAAKGVVAAAVKQVERSASGETLRLVPSPDVYAKLQRARVHRRQSDHECATPPGGTRSPPSSSTPAPVVRLSPHGDAGNAGNAGSAGSRVTPTQLTSKLELVTGTATVVAAAGANFSTPPSSRSTSTSSSLSLSRSHSDADVSEPLDSISRIGSEICRKDLSEALQRHPSSTAALASASKAMPRASGVLPLSITLPSLANADAVATDSADGNGTTLGLALEFPRHHSPSLQSADSGEVSPVGLRV